MLASLPPHLKSSLHTLNLHLSSLYIQSQIISFLPRNSLIAFIPNGSILPTVTPSVTTPLPDAVPFKSPNQDEITLPLTLPESLTPYLDVDKISVGFGVRPGVNLIVGGGYHGKSTLLNALLSGVTYQQPLGDGGLGRTYVKCLGGTVGVRAEDGRRVGKLDVRRFVSEVRGRGGGGRRRDDKEGGRKRGK